MAARCEECAYFVYDDEYEEYLCEVNLDEEDFILVKQGDILAVIE